MIEGDTEFQLKLRTLKEQGPGAGAKAGTETGDYTFALQNAVESVNLSLDDSRKLLAGTGNQRSKRKRRRRNST